MNYGLKIYNPQKINLTKPVDKGHNELGCECPACGHRVASGDEQCSHCGQKFNKY